MNTKVVIALLVVVLAAVFLYFYSGYKKYDIVPVPPAALTKEEKIKVLDSLVGGSQAVQGTVSSSTNEDKRKILDALKASSNSTTSQDSMSVEEKIRLLDSLRNTSTPN